MNFYKKIKPKLIASICLSLSILIVNGINYNHILFIIFLIIGLFVKGKNFLSNSDRFLGAELLISILLLSLNPGDLENLNILRAKMHSLSVYLPPIALIVSHEYFSVLNKSKLNNLFEIFPKLTFMSLGIILFNSLIRVPEGISSLNLLSFQIHRSFGLILVVYFLIILNQSLNTKARKIISYFPLLIFALLILISRSKAVILITTLSIFILFQKNLKNYFKNNIKISSSRVNLFFKAIIFSLLSLIISINVYSFFPYFFKNTNQFIGTLYAGRHYINFSHLEACRNFNLKKIKPSITLNQELNSRKLWSLGTNSSEYNKFRNLSIDNLIKAGYLDARRKIELINYASHNSFISYYCYHGINYVYSLTIFLILFLAITYFNTDFQNTLLLFASISSSSYEYMLFVPFILSLTGMFIYLNYYNHKERKVIE